jgi:hypothetical protein
MWVTRVKSNERRKGHANARFGKDYSVKIRVKLIEPRPVKIESFVENKK